MDNIDQNSTWRYPECETINSGDHCIICGQDSPIREEKKTCSCGYQNNKDARFCGKCGRRLDDSRIKNVFTLLFVATLTILAVFALVVVTPHIHKWEDATCTTPKNCKICGETTGEASAHIWEDATCKAPKTCKACGETSGVKASHQWVPATYLAPKTCSICGTTDGSRLEIPSFSPKVYVEITPEPVNPEDLMKDYPIFEPGW